MGRMHANVYKQLPTAELVACVDKNEETRDKYAAEFGLNAYATLEEMLANEQLDAVDICLPTYLHKDFAVRALEAGKHVFCEKPMAMNLAEADEMIAARDRSGKALMIGHCIRFWPEYALLKEMAEDGRYGKLLSLNLTRLAQFPSWSAENWLADEAKAGGGVLDMHIHDTDFALYLLGRPLLTTAVGNVDEKGPSYACTTFKYEGCFVHLEGGWNFPAGTPFRMTFRANFERGAAFMDGGPMTIYENGKKPFTPEFKKMEAQGGGNLSDLGGYYLELEYFVDGIQKGLPLEIVTPESSRETLKLVLEEIRQIKG
jgi:predicted dehydrogenase